MSPCPEGGTGQPLPRHPEPEGLKVLGAAELLGETCSSWGSRDPGKGCFTVPGRGEGLHNPHAEEEPNGEEGIRQEGP